MGSLKINIVVGGRFHAEQLYRALTELGHDVKIYASSPGRYFKNVPRNRVVFIAKPVQILQKTLKRRMPRFISEANAVAFDWLVARIMRPADIVWGFNGDSLYCGLRVKRQCGVYVLDRACPHFVAQEDLLESESRKIGYPYARFSDRMRRRFVREYEIADAIVVPSQYSLSSFTERGFAPSRIHVIPLDANAPSPNRLAGVRPTGRVSDESTFRVGIVGGSFLRKGILYLLRALKRLNRNDIVLYMRAPKSNVIAHPEASRLCDELNVQFVPYVEDINAFYRSLDAFVLPSVDEGFGMVVYEALMNGTPVIASTHVGAIDGLTPGEHLLVVPAGDEAMLASAIEQLHDRPDLRERIGGAGQQLYWEMMKNGSNYTVNLKSFIESVRVNARA